ncbi:adenylate kinase [Microbacterium sp. SLBN-146]|uniref:adenylate kinase n=1 Tax=Microbacterium sp. SLBN-146 TaxID=2768457 RepID=UPI00114E80A3|nr:adenylate kinase [Microbacterium sp. SLBN-146]TQJ29729.1 adenylate kinase [Microbacterium sp. SLBN-146]
MTDAEQHEAPRPARLVLVGPQGSGKGTQAERIAERFRIAAISTGDVFRQNIKDETDLGRQVKSIIDAGDLVSDALTFEVVRDRLTQPDAATGFLLDGFPRNLGQLGLLDTYLDEREAPLTAVLELGVPRAVSMDRLMRRAFEQGRTDDTEEAIANRLSIYERETAPILEVYRDHGLVDSIDGVGSLDEVTERIFSALAARGIVPAAV